MKKKDKKALKAKLVVGVKKLLTANNAVLTGKIEKALKKAVKLIVKKTRRITITAKKPAVAK